MFTKIFSSMLESSIWEYNYPTRLTWVAMLLMSDEDGIVLGTVGGIANRARVKKEEAAEAIKIFESPDPESSNPENDGRRIEKIIGGWQLLNYSYYRSLKSSEARKEYQREWQRNKRSKDQQVSTGVNRCQPSASVSQSESSASEGDARGNAFDDFWKAYPNRVAKADALKAFRKGKCDSVLPAILAALKWQCLSAAWVKDGGKFIPHPASWLNGRRWEDEMPTLLPAGGKPPATSDWNTPVPTGRILTSAEQAAKRAAASGTIAPPAATF